MIFFIIYYNYYTGNYVTDTNKTASCQDDYDPNSLDVTLAKEKIRQMLSTVTETETVTIREALYRTLAEDVLSSINVPAYTNSAMDGYAISSDDLVNTKTFSIAGTAFAGKPYTGSILPGQCIRIMTGAPICAGIDTVIMQEHVDIFDKQITLSDAYSSIHKAGQNIREKGEDLKQGSPAIKAGRRLSASDVGLLASLGISEVKIKRKLRIAILSTGDELRDLGEPLNEGQIYDSNRYTIYSMLNRPGIDIIDYGIVKDDPHLIRSAFQTASESADIIITSGGVSVGDADYVKQTLEELGTVNFWKIAMKPGRPLAVGKIKNAYFFGLPGNPVSAMVTFYQFLQPAIRQIMGQEQIENPSIQMKCISSLKKRPGRVEFQRGKIMTDENGLKVVKSTGNQGSHVLSSMSEANCFIILPMETGNVEADSLVEVQPFDGLI